MNTGLILALALAVLVLLIIVRLPIFLALLGAGFVGIVLTDGLNGIGHTLSRLMYDQPSRVILAVLPLFIVMGVYAKNSNISDQLFGLAAAATKRMRGGLAMATVVAGAGFGAISGSSTACAAALGPMSVRAMRQANYSPAFAAAVVGASGTLGILIPPSILMVLYGIASGESIGKLLIAGIVPGLLTALMYMVGISVAARIKPEMVGLGSSAGSSDQEVVERELGTRTREARKQALFSVGRVTVLFGVVVGGIYTGLLTVSEAAAYGAAVAIIFHAYDRIRHEGFQVWKRSFRESLLESVNINAMIFTILIGASFLSYVIVVSRAPVEFSQWVSSFDVPSWLLVAIFLTFLLPLGMFLDSTSIILICTPIIHPVITKLGYDGVWFAILFVKMLEIGLITPPVGINAFVVSGLVKDVRLERIFGALMIFIPIELLTVALLFVFPELVTYLPDLMSVT